MSFSDAVEQAILRYLTRNTAPTPPATVYVALFTVAPADDGTGGTEVSTGGSTNYVRQAVSCGASGTGSGSGWNDPTLGAGTTTNAAQISFPVAGAAYGAAVVFIAVFDAVTSGVYLGGGAPTDTSITITTGQQYVIPAGNFTWQQT